MAPPPKRDGTVPLTPDTLSLGDLPPDLRAHVEAMPLPEGYESPKFLAGIAAELGAALVPETGAGVHAMLARLGCWARGPEGSRWLAEENGRRAAAALLQRTDTGRRALAERLKRLGIPEDYELRRAALQPRDTPAVRAVRAAMAHREQRTDPVLGRPGLLVCLSGRSGLGKSVAAGAALVAHTGSGLWLTAATIAANPRTSFSTTEARWQEWIGVDLMVIDEWGDERDPGPVVDLTLARWNAGRVIVWTTNLDRAATDARIVDTPQAARLADRLAGQEVAVPWFVPLEGASLRHQQALALGGGR